MQRILLNDPPVPPIVPLPDGRLIALGERIGRGGFGEVWTVRLEGHPETLAGKFLHAEASAPERVHSSIERLRTEARILAMLDMKGIPRFEAMGMYEETPFILMQRIEGISWRALQQQKQEPLSTPFLFHCCMEQAGLIAELHEQGIVHSDIKPDNLLFGREEEKGPWQSWLIDFGLARDSATSATRITCEGQTIGTHGFLDPRHIGSAITRDPSGDIFSLGATWYEWASGAPLFREAQWLRVLGADPDECEEIFNAHIQQQIERCPKLHDGFAGILRDMLTFESASHMRPTARQIQERLLTLIAPRCTLQEWQARWEKIKQCSADSPLQAIDAYSNRLSSVPKPHHGIIATLAGATTLSIALLLGINNSPTQEQQPEQAESSQSILQQPDLAPVATPYAHRLDYAQDVLKITKGPELLFACTLQESPLLGSTQRTALQLRTVSIEAQELCPLLEQLRRGSSAGLPKRTYTCYCSILETPEGKDVLLITVRGLLHAPASGPHVFYTTDALDDPALKHLGSWPLEGKLLDRVYELPSTLTAEEGQKVLTKANEALRMAQQKAGLRPKLTRQPKG